MSAKIYDTTQQAFVDAETPKVHDGSAYVDSQGMSYDSGAWKEDWTADKSLKIYTGTNYGGHYIIGQIIAVDSQNYPWNMKDYIDYISDEDNSLSNAANCIFDALIDVTPYKYAKMICTLNSQSSTHANVLPNFSLTATQSWQNPIDTNIVSTTDNGDGTYTRIFDLSNISGSYYIETNCNSPNKSSKVYSLYLTEE